ncbi:MAG TPA: glutathione S-transferase family protein [Rickettsiales bacterium]|nr:glutathione S-transferase family protein [Rickettsiales bacterium]
MYKLYYFAGACSMAPHVILNELGQEVTLVNGRDAQGKATEELLKVSPRGVIPVLEDNGHVIHEGAAIILHLLEKHKNNLMPASGPARTDTLQWLMFCNATLHPAYARLFFALKALEGDAQAKVLEATYAYINKLWAEVEERLSQSPFLAGQELTVADILLTVIANWSTRFEGKIKIGEHTKQLLRKVSARPAYQKALATEQVEYKAAA